jgi:hypothetical protein
MKTGLHERLYKKNRASLKKLTVQERVGAETGVYELVEKNNSRKFEIAFIYQFSIPALLR